MCVLIGIDVQTYISDVFVFVYWKLYCSAVKLGIRKYGFNMIKEYFYAKLWCTVLFSTEQVSGQIFSIIPMMRIGVFDYCYN